MLPAMEEITYNRAVPGMKERDVTKFPLTP